MWSLFSRLLTILSVLGLQLALASAPCAAMGAHHASAASSKMSMSDTMPCCPDQMPSAPGSEKSCPLAIVCCAKTFPSMLNFSVVAPVRFTIIAANMPDDDIWHDLLAEPPPLKPPRA